MKKLVETFTLLLFVVAALPPELHAQGEAGLTVNQITTSPLGNGMGGITATVPSPDPFAPNVNPAQLGLFSLTSGINAGFLTPKTPWLNLSGLAIGVSAVNAGYNLQNALDLPFALSVGAGYSHARLDLGTFTMTGPDGPNALETFRAYEQATTYSFALGFDYYLRFGIGLNLRRTISDMGFSWDVPPVPAVVHASAVDVGAIMVVPVGSMVSPLWKNPLSPLTPLLDLSMSYVHANHGDDIRYVADAHPDPQPRTAIVGLGLEVGFNARVGSSDWRVASFTLARQAEDLLVERFDNGTFEYESGAGEINILKNVIGGEFSNQIVERKGWEIEVGECLFLRGGSVHGRGYNYETSGYSLSLGGLVRTLEFVSPAVASNRWVAFVGEHVDLQYHSSRYVNMGDTEFSSLVLVWKGLP